MMMARALLVALLLFGLSTAASAFDPRQHRSPLAGPPTAVMVLGTPHLSGLPESFDPATLGLLLDRLAIWKPDRILVEGLSGQQCDMLRRYAELIPDATDGYCMDPTAAAAASGLDVPAALAAIDRTLDSWPAEPTAAERRRLALLFLAAGERASALVQWLYLPAAERRAADGLTPELVTSLDATITRRNQNYLVAAPLAVRLGQQRLWLMDDHSADYVLVKMGEDYGQAMKRAWDNPVGRARLAEARRRENAAVSPMGTMAMMRYYNEPAEATRAFRSDFGAAMAQKTPELFGRRYLGWWETRNLRMAANIREASASIPGKRLLVLTGASHKGYLDAYLGMMHDVRVADPLPLLR